jgi:hypothetical protein
MNAMIDADITRLYAGPLDDFIARRDARAKELRASGDKDGAATVKQLRKPSRAAWALDIVAIEQPDAMAALMDAVSATARAQSSGGDVRAAMAAMRAAVRAFATCAAEVAERARYSLDAATLGNDLLAVLGAPDDFTLLRSGRLVDIPDGGGLDALSTLAASGPRLVVTAPAQERAAPTPASSQEERAAHEAERREARRRAEQQLAAARKRAAASEIALRNAESKLNGAEMRLRTAEDNVREAREQLERAREEAHAAAVALQEAESTSKA